MWSMPEPVRRWAVHAVRMLRSRGGADRVPSDPPGPDGLPVIPAEIQPESDQDGRTIAAGLTAFGLGSGTRIAVMGLTPDGDRAAVDAIELLGAEAVLVPDHAHGPRLRLRLRGVRAVLTQSPHVPQIAAVVGDLPDLQHLWSWDAGGRDELIAAAHGRMPAFQE
ncbi:hypothetical protein ABLG96_13185 [Nakamurella sp. A5-74]|uniref:AMP-binding protein n=1 Tax=Nakamurella sp. A5-74 TaxID=3158264 RepID=A0AAU8DLK6_9ACTN